MRRGSLRFDWPAKVQHSDVALEIGALPGYANGLMRDGSTIFYFRRCHCGDQRKTYVSQQPHRSFFGVVLHADGFSLPVGENEFDRLVRLRDSRRAVESYSTRLCMDFLRGRSRPFCHPLRILRALQIKLNLAAANNALSILLVLATMRVYDVVPLAGLSENRDLDVLQQACGIVFEVRGLRRLHSK